MADNKFTKDILIIGAGPAGLTAAIYASRYGLNVAVFEKMSYGGQVSQTPEVDNYPGIKSISGFEFSQNIYDQALSTGAEIVMTEIESFDITGRVKKITTTQGEYSGGAVIIANGARRRHLNCPGEEEFAGRGVSYCATCDGNFFKNQDVAIAGGGNTALEDALFLSNLCSKVYLIHRRNEFRGMKSLSDAVRARSNIELILDSTVESINGDSKVSSVTVKNTVSQSLNELNVSAIFVAVGTEPENKFFKEILKLDKRGYIDASEDCATTVPGVFAAGDTRAKPLRQIVTATADGATSAFMAANYLNTLI